MNIRHKISFCTWFVSTTLFAFAGTISAATEDSASAQPATRFEQSPAQIKRVPNLRVSMTPIEAQVMEDDGGVAGCQPKIVTLTSASFTGGQYIVQAGFAETETAAAEYHIPIPDFPLKIDLVEMIFATSNTNVTTTTHWSILFFEGNPQTGTNTDTFSSDDVILPHIVIPPGTNGVNVQFSVDPMDPDQIILNDNATHSITVGYRIDQHNQQTQDPCFIAPPTNKNAFPTTDTGPLNFPGENWIFAVDCGIFGCPAGWHRFSQFAPCTPSGDWVIRLTYTPVNCVESQGACCESDGNCLDMLTQSQCNVISGSFQGTGTNCGTVSCPQIGACCHPNGSCTEVLSTSCSDDFQGNGTACAMTNCPQPPQACCFMGPPSSCSNLAVTDCNGFGGIPQGTGSTCANTVCFPMGACCKPDGSCQDNQSPGACSAVSGTFQGNNSTCSGVSCPQPTGACCSNSTTFCSVITQANCGGIPNTTWAGAFTNCTGDADGDGEPDACEAPSTCTCSTTADCKNSGCALDNACNCAACSGGACAFTCAKFGNVNCDAGQNVNLDDILCVLGGFSNFSNCPNGDIDPCGGNGIINLDDILKVLAAFGGANPCGCDTAASAPLCGSISP